MSAGPTLSPLAQRLQEMRDMRAYWLSHIDRQTEGYGPDDALTMLQISERACQQVARDIIAAGVQP